MMNSSSVLVSCVVQDETTPFFFSFFVGHGIDPGSPKSDARSVHLNVSLRGAVGCGCGCGCGGLDPPLTGDRSVGVLDPIPEMQNDEGPDSADQTIGD